MLNPIRRALGVGLILLATAPAAAAAQGGPRGGGPPPPPPPPAPTTLNTGSSFAWQGCGGSSFFTCASIHVTLSTASQVTMTITNNSGAAGTFPGTLFTQIGLFNLPKGATYFGSLQVFDASSQSLNGWQLGTSGLSGSGIQKVVLGVDTQRGVNAALAPGATHTFVFTIADLPTTFVLAQDFAVHGQSGPNGCSTKLVVTGGTANSGPLDPACGYNVVPEPMTLTLLATGLVGLAGAGWMRRRRRRQPAA